ncbi:hypothetical protein HBB16_16330, partial [Pseudonocardia sp. MCCB 268]|nr:hypothetical protein [Pseudonocardia cytotoxica]
MLTYLSPRFHPARHGDTDAAVAYLAVSPRPGVPRSRRTGRHDDLRVLSIPFVVVLFNLSVRN